MNTIEAAPIIEARAIEKWFEQPDGRRAQVIAPTDLTLYAGSIVALLGPSGSGKSTLLRMLSGLAAASAGEVVWHTGAERADGQRVAIVFQNFALFPWLTVQENVEAPLQAQGQAPTERRERALRMLDAVGLDGFESAFPKELSGGMKQRVGLARALAVDPDVLFMDEPFSAVDVLTAEALRGELLELWLKRRMPTRAIFLVTHNIEEAVLLADRVLVLGKSPGHIRADFGVHLSHPRDRKGVRFTEYVDYIYTVLTRPEAEPPPAPSRPRRPEALALPHAHPAAIAGSLELLAERGGRDDLYRLADDLNMEADDLLPSLEAAALLGWAQLREGDVELTDEGRGYAAADILERKIEFRRAALARIPQLQRMEARLRAQPDEPQSVDDFAELLRGQFGEEEAERQLATALDWGRYGELFDYDAEAGQLLAPEATEPGA